MRVGAFSLKMPREQYSFLESQIGGGAMNAHDRLANERSALGVIEQLRDALRHADDELRRRCVISGKVRDALGTAERFLASNGR